MAKAAVTVVPSPLWPAAPALKWLFRAPRNSALQAGNWSELSRKLSSEGYEEKLRQQPAKQLKAFVAEQVPEAISTRRMIVMGSHHPERNDYMPGPNAARVVRHADCSVIMVREQRSRYRSSGRLVGYGATEARRAE